MSRIKKQINYHLQQLEKTPDDLYLLNKIGLLYMDVGENEDQDLYYLERAYNTKKTVPSCHNLAWWLFFEYDEPERALAIQRECLALAPKSYLPYNAYAFMVLYQKEFGRCSDISYQEVIDIFKIAARKSSAKDITHNIGVSYFQLEEYEAAKPYFLKSYSKERGLSQYGLILTALKLNQIAEAKALIEVLGEGVDKARSQIIGNHEMVELYSALGDYEMAKNWLFKIGLDRIHWVSWTRLAYTFYKHYPMGFQRRMGVGIENQYEFIEVYKNGSPEQKAEYEANKHAFLKPIKVLRGYLADFPKADYELPPLRVYREYGGNSLFGHSDARSPENDLHD